MAVGEAVNPSFERIIQNLPEENALTIPLLRDFASPPGIVLTQRLDRRYKRLCFVQEELKNLSERNKEKISALSFDDFVFSNMDFTRYAKIPQTEFDFYLQGMSDYDNTFFTKNFKKDAMETKAIMVKAYKKADSFFSLEKPNPLILSIMRSLDTSLEFVPLAAEPEILKELNDLYRFLNSKKIPRENQDEKGQDVFSLETINPFFNFLLDRLDGLCITHNDKNETKLFIDSQGSLNGIFMPGGKPWTLRLM